MDYYLLCDYCGTRSTIQPGSVVPMRCDYCAVEFDDVNVIRHPSQTLFIGIHQRIGVAKAALVGLWAIVLTVTAYYVVRFLLTVFS